MGDEPLTLPTLFAAYSTTGRTVFLWSYGEEGRLVFAAHRMV